MLFTAEHYLEFLRCLNFKAFLFGERVDNLVDHPIIHPLLNVVGKAYELAFNEEYKGLMVVPSSLKGEPNNRFNHLNQNTEDLIKIVKCRGCQVKKGALIE